MKINTAATNTTDKTIFFDHLEGEVYTGQPRVTVDPPHSPLRRLQGRLQASRQPVVYGLGNLVSSFRYWMDRLIR